jgi:hypothetical protein
MGTRKNHSSRRAFFLHGGAALGAGVASTTGAAALLPASATAQTDLADREAIRQLHLAFIAAVEAQSRPGAAATHRAYRANAAQLHDELAVDAGGRRATARWHVDVKLATPLEGDSTVAQMARLQGQFADQRWEAGRLQARYEKHGGQWQLAAVEYLPS